MPLNDCVLRSWNGSGLFSPDQTRRRHLTTEEPRLALSRCGLGRAS